MDESPVPCMVQGDFWEEYVMKKIVAKMIAVMRECSHIAKNGTNSFHGYTYATSADVLSKVNAALVEQGLASLVIPELISLEEVKTAKGNIEHLATVKVNITLIDRDSDESVLITGLGSGQDSGDKAVMKAQTAAVKYAYMLSLSISTGDDPEADTRTDESTSVDPSRKTTPIKTTAKSRAVAIPRKQEGPAAGATSYCEECGIKLTDKVRAFSESRYHRMLCMDCQKRALARA